MLANALRRASCRRTRSGAVLVLVAILMVAMFAIMALSIDIGYVATVRTELDRANDAGALAGAGMLIYGAAEAKSTVRRFVKANLVGARQVLDSEITIETGYWDPETRIFVPGSVSPSAVRVTTVRPSQPYHFARVLGHDAFDLSSQSIAMYEARDIMLVLDYSGSMNDDSELKKIGELGQAAIEANLLEIYQELGSPIYGDMQWQPQYIESGDTSFIKKTLGLTYGPNGDVPYPFPSGGWNDYINYVTSNSNINAAGYLSSYGYLTLANYWLEEQPQANETPGLWQTSEQPLTAVKDSVQVYLAEIEAADMDDQVGLVAYTAADGTAKIELELTDNLQLVEDLSRQRQAAHYVGSTNIGAGIQAAVDVLQNRGRLGKGRLIVLMTDGVANRPVDTVQGRQFALDQAAAAAAAKIRILTISLGTGADTALMQSIADMTGGEHFNVPGGQAVADYEQQLKDVLLEISKERPLKLVE